MVADETFKTLKNEYFKLAKKNEHIAIKFAEWIIKKDIVQLNSEVWAKNNPEFNQNYAKNTKMLYRMFIKEEEENRVLNEKTK